MTIEKTINVKFTDKELIKFIGDRVVDLEDGETWELLNSYSYSNEYTFRVIKKDEGDNNEEH